MKGMVKIETKNIDTGNKLRILRHKFGYSQQQVADALEISKSTYCRMESNNTNVDMDKLQKIFRIYAISANDFFEMTFPVRHSCVIPKVLLDNLEEALEKYENITDDWNLNRGRFNRLREVFDPVFEVRMKACDFPELDLTNVESETIVKTVELDIRGEELIQRYFDLQKKYCKALFGEN